MQNNPHQPQRLHTLRVGRFTTSAEAFSVQDYLWYSLSVKACLCCVLKSCLTLCDPMDCSLPGSSVHGVLQAEILEWIAMPSARRSSQPRDRTQSLPSPALAGGFFTTSATWEALRSLGHVNLPCHPGSPILS